MNVVLLVACYALVGQPVTAFAAVPFLDGKSPILHLPRPHYYYTFTPERQFNIESFETTTTVVTTALMCRSYI